MIIIILCIHICINICTCVYIYIYIYIKYPVCCSERHGVLSASIAEHQDHANRC